MDHTPKDNTGILKKASTESAETEGKTIFTLHVEQVSSPSFVQWFVYLTDMELTFPAFIFELT